MKAYVIILIIKALRKTKEDINEILKNKNKFTKDEIKNLEKGFLEKFKESVFDKKIQNVKFYTKDKVIYSNYLQQKQWEEYNILYKIIAKGIKNKKVSLEIIVLLRQNQFLQNLEKNQDAGWNIEFCGRYDFFKEIVFHDKEILNICKEKIIKDKERNKILDDFGFFKSIHNLA